MKPTLQYAILANPASGNLPTCRRYALLKQAADLLSADVHGLDTASAEEFSQCAREQAERCDVLVVAGGDGTFSLALNAVETPSTALAFLPFGTGNALTYALGYRGGTEEIAASIRAVDTSIDWDTLSRMSYILLVSASAVNFSKRVLALSTGFTASSCEPT